MIKTSLLRGESERRNRKINRTERKAHEGLSKVPVIMTRSLRVEIGFN